MNIFLIILLIANCIFYSLLDLTALPVLIAVSVITYFAGRYLFSLRQKSPDKGSKPLCIFFVALLVTVLCFFKYMPQVKLPVGMSFYMLMAISFVIDCNRGEFCDFPSILEVMAYISFFPTVVSGPIMKSKDLIPQFANRKKLTSKRLTRALWLIVIGLFMKFVMADRLAVAVDKVYAAPLVYSGLTLFITSITYTLQLLFDFAGYSYMAIGVACLLGFDIMSNFNLPYMATNPSAFWRRWHISLSSWLKDYVYIPLGGSRKGSARTYINILLVMVISGLWHGSTINFLIWGILHGIGQMIHRLVVGTKKDANKTVRILSMTLNFLFVNFLWIPFRMPTLSGTWTVFTRIVTFAEGAGYYYVYTFIFLAMMMIAQIIGAVKFSKNSPLRPLPLDKLYSKIIFCMVVILTAMFAYFGNGAFIYSQF